MRHLRATSVSVLALLLSAGIASAQTSQGQPQAQQAAARQLEAALQGNRDRVRDAIRDARIEETSIESSHLREGSVLPPTVDLSPVPDRVVQLVPGLRGHSVVRTRDQLVFVDTRTRRVVELMPLSAADRQAMGRDQSAQGQPAAAAVAIVFIPLQQQQHWLASRFMDRTVHNLQNEEIGEVEDILMGSDGRVQALVIGVGGFLGIGEKSIAVPFDRFELQPANGMWAARDTRLVLRTTRDDLTNAPAFREREEASAARTTNRDQRGERNEERSRQSPSGTTAPAR